MSKNDKKEVRAKDTQHLRSLTIADLKKELLEITKDEFKLRMQKTIGQAIKPHLIKQARRRLAKAKTLLTEKNRSAAKGA